MNYLYEPPVNMVLSVAFLASAGVSLFFSIQRFMVARNFAGEYLGSVYIVRGIRWLIFALTAFFWSANFYWHAEWLFIIGLVILGQELYECAFLSAALHEGVKIDRGRKSFP